MKLTRRQLLGYTITGVGVVAGGSLTSALGQIQLIPDEDDKGRSLEEMMQLLDRPTREFEAPRSPADGELVMTNPPVFVWLPIKGVSEYVLQYSQDPRFEATSTIVVKSHLTVHAPRSVVAHGRWYWRYGYEPSISGEAVYGRAREFTIAEDALRLPFPDVNQVIERLRGVRPRLLFTPESVQRSRELGRSELRAVLEEMKRKCDEYLGQELMPEPEFLPDTPDRVEKYERMSYTRTGPFLEAMGACAEIFLLSEDEKYGLEAKRRLMHLVSWDPSGSTSLAHNDDPGTRIVHLGARAYDYVYDLLTEGEREQCRRCFAARMPQLYRALRGGNPSDEDPWKRSFEVNPYESHAYGYYVPHLTEACIAFAGEIEVREWLEYMLLMVWAPFFPPFGGPEGGWCEGAPCWGWGAEYMLRLFRVAEVATGQPVLQRHWARNTGYFKLYSNPPYSKMSPFGDGETGGAGGGGGADTMSELARTYGNRHFQWFVDEQGFRPADYRAFLLHDQQVKAKAPTDLPQARNFADVGLACMHSSLADGEQNVHVLLRSSPFGGISHSHPDQNAFTLHAFGEPLAIVSGYTPWYGSPHTQEWSWRTKSSNSIEVDNTSQPMWRMAANGTIAQFETNEHCFYARGEAAAAYEGRLRRFDRHLVYLRPLDEGMTPFVVIYDDLVSADKSTYQWWLHALEEMEVNPAEQTVRIARGNARLDVHFLIPVGLAFSQTDQFPVPPEREQPNQWHLKAETMTPTESCQFLTALLPYRADQSKAKRSVTLQSGEGRLAVEVVAEGKRHVVTFRTGQADGTAIAIAGTQATGDICIASWDVSGRLLRTTSITRTS